MNRELELKLLAENQKLKERLDKLEGKSENGVPIYTFSSIKPEELENLVDIKQNIQNETIFDSWFDNDIEISNDTIEFLAKLIKKRRPLMKYYKEEDLKIHFLTPLFNRIDFTSYENNFRDFYNEKLTYKTDKFIFSGETDFMLASGLFRSEKPFFFIQEFKQEKIRKDPEPQLLAELISAIELNSEKIIKGAYIVGSIWNFVILEKVKTNSYQYYVSINFDSTKIEDLKSIYKNLLFIKKEIVDRTTNRE